jgi:ATP-dependent Clp protease ATP-binding subunit ClpX
MRHPTDDRKRRDDCRCSFCGRPRSQVERLISSGCERVSICAECVTACSDLLGYGATGGPPRAPAERSLPKPQAVYEALNQYVIGQERAKRVLSVAVYNHYQRTHLGASAPEVELQKSNLLLLGPTGSGKTLLARTLARILEVPFAVADATALTEAGYVGEDVESILLRLYQGADYDLERAQQGIVYLDEIDKIGRKSDHPSAARDVSGEGVQQALLSILDGTTVTLPPPGARMHPHQECVRFDSANVLFICGGTFEGLERIIRERENEHPLGFASLPAAGASGDRAQAPAPRVLPEDLVRYGLLPELVGRLPVIVALSALSRSELARVLLEPRNSLVRQYEKFFEWDGVELRLEPAALDAIADEALTRKTGARGLRSVMEEVMLDTMYDLPSLTGIRRCLVTEDTVRRRAAPLLLTADEVEPRWRRRSQAA